jgi:Ca-activated chloride channel family protein
MAFIVYDLVWSMNIKNVFMSLQTIQWGSAESLWLVGLLSVIGIILLAYRLVRVKRTVSVLASTRLARTMLHNFSWRRVYVRLFLVSGALFFLVLSLLRPQLTMRDEIVKQQGRDLLIALDISRSMLAQDVAPSRLVAAKQKIEQLVRSLSCERVGLILFSGSAIVQCPLTADHDAFFMFLHDVDVESIASGTTAMDQALLRALEVYESTPDRKHKMLMLFTDGEDFSSSLARIRDRAKQVGLTIFTVGVGTTEGAPIPLFNDHGKRNGFIKNARGSVVVSRRDDGILYALAHEAGGVYIPMTADENDIEVLVAQVTLREKELFGEKIITHAYELYPYGCLISFVLLLFEWII